MSRDDYETAARLIEEHAALADFEGPKLESLIRKAEAALGLDFPPTYRRFLAEFGAGDFAGEEFYGLIDDNFESSTIPDGIWLTLRERNNRSLPSNLIIVYAVGEGTVFALNAGKPNGVGEFPVVAVPIDHRLKNNSFEMMAEDFGRFFLDTVRGALA